MSSDGASFCFSLLWQDLRDSCFRWLWGQHCFFSTGICIEPHGKGTSERLIDLMIRLRDRDGPTAGDARVAKLDVLGACHHVIALRSVGGGASVTVQTPPYRSRLKSHAGAALDDFLRATGVSLGSGAGIGGRFDQACLGPGDKRHAAQGCPVARGFDEPGAGLVYPLIT